MSKKRNGSQRLPFSFRLCRRFSDFSIPVAAAFWHPAQSTLGALSNAFALPHKRAAQGGGLGFILTPSPPCSPCMDSSPLWRAFLFRTT
ncbi:protein of unknown function (plasmid) [Paraburkholderia dioscoreae]|uniref:Uncharacterized protein n=1 Tax=Paraburkholderia dioscoreae TaxID=2604047 RepID=A0A5Q4ZLJ2_9BURK|nr:protein of unknown function [Paraburkholderia dioscoreae]